MPLPSFITDGPWWGLFLALFVVVLLRAQATYWVGRWARRGTGRLTKRMDGPAMQAAERFLDRWGFIGVPLSFLTIGFQTAVNAAAGYTRMRWDLYTAAMVPGCIAWAATYATLGLSLIEAWKTSPWLLAAVVGGLVAVAFVATRLRRRVQLA